MNKIYKLVYSKTLNNLVAVSEIAASNSVGSVDKRAKVSHTTDTANGRSFGNILLGAALIAGAPAVATAATGPKTETTPTQPVATQSLYDGKIQVDAQSAGLSVADHHGTAVVNIVNPDQAGVSDNRFKTFSTDKGAVFNNQLAGNSKNFVNSKILGEKLAANPNLKREAQTILAQITGNDKSVIKGALEVLGKKADLMIINPNGIDLNGSSLYNVRDFTASTAEVNANNAHSLDVQRGEINVNGDLTTDDVNMIRLIAQAVKVKATIAPTKGYRGKKADIIVSGGKQKFDLDTNTATASSAGSSATPEVAISGSAMGSMYGNKVNFIVSESGAGVEFDGMVMGDNDISFTADGKVQVNRVLSKEGTVTLDAGANHGVEVGTAAATQSFSNAEKDKHSDGVVTTNVLATKTTTSTSSKTVVNTATSVDQSTATTDTAKLNDKKAKQKFVSARKVVIKGQTVKAQDALIAGKDSVEITSANELGHGFDVDIQDSVVSGHQVDLHGAAIKLSKESKILADHSNVVASTLVKQDGLIYADTSNVETTSENGMALISGKTIANTATVKTSDARLTGASFTTGTFNLDADKVNAKGASVEANVLNVKYDTSADANSFATDAKTKLTANTFNLVGTEGATLGTQSDFDRAEQMLQTVIANHKTVSVDNFLVDKNTEVKSFSANAITVKDTFRNSGILNLSQRSFDGAATDTSSKNAVIVNAKTFENYGLLLADRLGVKSADQIKLNGATFVYQDLTLVAPQVFQQGTVTTGGNLNAITDQYHVEAQLSGDVTVKGADENTAVHFADWRARRDYYEVQTQIGQLDGSAIKVAGGEIIVKGDFTIVPLSGTKYAEGTTAYGKEADKNVNRLEAVNADIYVGGNLALDGNLSTKVKAFETSVMDLLKMNSSHVQLTFKPTTWIKTDLMRGKTQKFDNLYSLFQGVFGNDPEFHWHNGAYTMTGDHIMDTLKGSLKDAYTNKIFSVVFGSDWRHQSYGDMKAKWNNFLAHPDDAKVALWAPGAQIVTGGSIDQINGNVDIGTDAEHSTVLTDAQGRNYAIKVEQAQTLDAQKLTRDYDLDKTVGDLVALGAVKVEDGRVVSRYQIPFLKNVANFATFAQTDAANMYLDNQAAAEVVLQQVRAETGTYYFSTNTDANIVNGLLSATVAYNDKVAEINHKYDSLLSADASDDARRQIEAQRTQDLAYAKASMDRIEFVKVAGTDKLAPKVVLSPKTLDRAQTLGASAAVLNAKDAIRIHNADSVNSNYGTISAETVAIKANSIDLTTNGIQNAVIAEKSGFSTDDFNLEGSASFGDLSLQAKNATFESAAHLNDAGDLQQVGNVYTKAAQVDIENDLSLKGFTFASTGDAAFNVGGNLDLSSEYEVASRYSKQDMVNSFGSKDLHEAAYVVKGSTLVGDKTVDITTGKSLTLESSRLAGDGQLNVNVGDELKTDSSVNVYDAKSHTEKLDFTLGGQADIASVHAEGDVHLGTLNGPKTTSLVDKNASVSAAGSPTVQAGLGVSYSHADDTVTEVKTANNALDSNDLNVKVEHNADLSNTDINKAAQAIAEKRAADNKTDIKVPSATIEAESVTTAQQGVDISSSTHTETSFDAGLKVTAGGAIADTVSHVASAARAKSLDEKLDGTLALTAVGDVTGLMARDLVHAGVHASVGVSKTDAESETVATNRNTMAGDVAITTKDDLSLKAVDASKANNVKLDAGSDLSVEGGVATTTSKQTSWNLGASAALTAGASGQGGAVAASGSVSGGGQFSSSEATTHQNTNIDGANVELKGQNIDLTSTTVTAEKAKVEATDTLSVTSEQDTVKSTTNGFGLSASGGVSLNSLTKVTPFGSVGANYNHHKVDNAVVAEQSGVTATESLDVKADTAKLTGAHLAADSSSVQTADGTAAPAATAKVDVNNVEATDIQDHRYEDGGSVGLSIGVNKYGSVTADISGGRDKQDHYKATNTATIAGQGVEAADIASKTTVGTVNTDVAKTTDVHQDYKVQDTAFGITVNDNVINQVKKGAEKVKEAAQAAKETIKNAAGVVVDAIKDAAQQVADGKIDVTLGGDGSYNGPDVTLGGTDSDTATAGATDGQQHVIDGQQHVIDGQQTTDGATITVTTDSGTTTGTGSVTTGDGVTITVDGGDAGTTSGNGQQHVIDSQHTVSGDTITVTTDSGTTTGTGSVTSADGVTITVEVNGQTAGTTSGSGHQTVSGGSSSHGHQTATGGSSSSGSHGYSHSSGNGVLHQGDQILHVQQTSTDLVAATSTDVVGVSNGYGSAVYGQSAAVGAGQTVVTDQTYIIRNGVAYPVYYPHGSLSGTSVLGSNNYISGTVAQGTVHSTTGAAYSLGSGYYATNGYSSAVAYHGEAAAVLNDTTTKYTLQTVGSTNSSNKFDAMYGTHTGSNSSSYYGNNSGSVSGSYYGNGASHSSGSTNSGVLFAGSHDSCTCSLANSGASSRPQATGPRVHHGSYGNQPYDYGNSGYTASSGSHVGDSITRVETGSSSSSSSSASLTSASISSSHATGPRVHHGSYGNQPYDFGNSGYTASSGPHVGDSITRVETGTGSTSVTTGTSSIDTGSTSVTTVTGGQTVVTDGGLTITDVTPSTPSTPSTTVTGGQSTIDTAPAHLTDATASNVNTHVTTEDTSYTFGDTTSDSSSSSSSGALSPSAFGPHILDNANAMDKPLANQYHHFAETGGVDTSISGSYSDIFAPSAGSAKPGVGGGTTDVQSAEQLLHNDHTPEFSNYGKQLEQTNKQLAQAEQQRKDLEGQLANTQDPAAKAVIQDKLTDVNSQITDNKATVAVIKDEVAKTTVGERNSIDYVRHTFDGTDNADQVTQAGGTDTPKVVNNPLKVVETGKADGSLKFDNVDKYIGVVQAPSTVTNSGTPVADTPDTGKPSTSTPNTDKSGTSTDAGQPDTGTSTPTGTTDTGTTPTGTPDSAKPGSGHLVDVNPAPTPDGDTPVKEVPKPKVDLTTGPNTATESASAQNRIPAANPNEPISKPTPGTDTDSSGTDDTTIKDPVKPVTPTEPTDPVTPVTPTDPTEPVTPVTPTEPTDPVTPVTPTDPTEPVTPVTPTEPTDPVTPVTPTEPTDPVTPVTPSEPTDPVTPVTPSEPTDPVTPVTPSEPTDPVTPVTPSEPTDPVTPVTPSEPTDPVTPVTPVEPTNPTPDVSIVPDDNIDQIRAEIRKIADSEFRNYEDVTIPTLTDPNVNWDDSTFAYIDTLDGTNVLDTKPARVGNVQFASTKPRKAPTQVGFASSNKEVASTARKPSKVSFASAGRKARPAVTPVRSTSVAFASAHKPSVTPVATAPKPTSVAFSSARPSRDTNYLNATPTPGSSKFVSEIDDTIDSLSCVNPLVGNLHARIDNFKGNALVIQRSMSVQPNFDNVLASINDYEAVFGAGKSYNSVDTLRTDLGYRTAAAQADAERQDTLKRKQIEFASTQLQTVAVEMDKLRQRAMDLREAAQSSADIEESQLAAELAQIKQQELGLLKQYKDLRTAIYSLTEGYNFGFTVSNDTQALSRLLENLSVVANGDDTRSRDDVFVTIQNLDTYLYGQQSVQFSSVQKVKSVVTFDNYASNNANYNDDKKLYAETQEAISYNAKNLRMRVANLHLELKAIADDYQAIAQKAASLTSADERAANSDKLQYIKDQAVYVIEQLDSINLNSSVDLVKTMENVTDVENQVLDLRNQVSDLLGGKAAAIKYASDAKAAVAANTNSVLEDKEKAQFIVDSITGGQKLAGGVKVYNPLDIDVLTKTEVETVNAVADLRAKARKARQQQANNSTNNDNEQ